MKNCKTCALHTAGECNTDMSIATGCATGCTSVTVNGKTIEISMTGKFIYKGHVIGDSNTSAAKALGECKRIDEMQQAVMA